MSDQVHVQKGVKTLAGVEPARSFQPPVPERKLDHPDLVAGMEHAARLGHSLGAIRVSHAAPSQAQVMPLIQRQEIPEEEEDEELQMQREPTALQRQENPEEEEEELQMQREPAALQRQENPQEEDEELQMQREPAALQRQENPEEEEEELQMQREPAALQRQENPEEEEEELQMQRKPAALQRQEIPEEEDEELQMQREPAALKRQESPEEEELQMKPKTPRVGLEGGKVPPAVESAINRTRGAGQPLDEAVQAQMGTALGHDFSRVQVHTGAEAHALNKQLSAKAFTTGRDIFFRQGEYNPGSGSGRELLAHELAHVVQQSTGRVRGDGGVIKVQPEGDRFEYEAESVAHISQTQHEDADLGRRDGSGMNIQKKALTHQTLARSGVIQRKLTFQPEWNTEREHKEEKKDAVRAAILRAKVRVSYANVEDRERYSEWFGKPDNQAKVVDTLGKVSTSLNKDITVHADFAETAYAYVKTSQPDHIWIAKAFLDAWSDSDVIDSTAGVLIHEVSHYAANTEDWAYGQDGCRKLASDKPAKAIENADSYEYFCESFNW